MITTNAAFSNDRKYRYALWRIWDDSKPLLMFIGLNPSTADERTDDPTIRRCGGFAKYWGYGGFYITNLFAFRATFPADLKKEIDPIGPDNDKWLRQIEFKVNKVVFIWGVHGTFMNRNLEVIQLFHTAYCIGLSKEGHPKHPLYLKSNMELKLFKTQTL